MKHRTTQSALLVAGAAAGVAAVAAAWVGKRRHMAGAAPDAALDQETPPDQAGSEDEQTAVRRRPQPSQLEGGSDDYLALISADLLAAERPELPLGRSADPAIDHELRSTGLQDDTSTGALFSEPEPDRPVSEDISLDQIWDAAPRPDEGERGESYDAVRPEEMGSVWLERATETTREERPYTTSDPTDFVGLDDLMVSEATRASALPLDDAETEENEPPTDRATIDLEDIEDEEDPNDVQEDDLDVDEKRDRDP